MNHVVLIEDDPSMRQLLTIFLGMEQFETTALENFEPSTVIDHLQAVQPQFILMDVHLAGADGLKLLSAVREHPDLDHVRIMMTSGEDCGDTCLELGANGFLLKPYNPADLVDWFRTKD